MLSVGVQRTHYWKKNYTSEKLFFSAFCFPQTKLIRLISFINGVHKTDAINKNRSLEIFFRKMCFSINLFEWQSYKWGLLKTDDRREKIFFWERFHRNSFHIKFFDWFGMIYQWGYTPMMMEIKTIYKI